AVGGLGGELEGRSGTGGGQAEEQLTAVEVRHECVSLQDVHGRRAQGNAGNGRREGEREERLTRVGKESGGGIWESWVDQVARSPKSNSAARAALNPQAPWTPAPGWVEAEAR